MLKKIYSVASACFIFLSASAQRDQISLTPEYNIPVQKLGWSYQASPGIAIGYAHVSGRRFLRQVGFSIGYTRLQNRADTLYYVVDNGTLSGVGLGKAAYSTMQLIQVKGIYDIKFPIKEDKLYVGGGLVIGAFFGARTMSFTDNLGGSEEYSEAASPWAALAPRIGFEYFLTDQISLEPTLSYTIMTQAGSTNPNSIRYNPNTLDLYYFLTAGVKVNYSF